MVTSSRPCSNSYMVLPLYSKRYRPEVLSRRTLVLTSSLLVKGRVLATVGPSRSEAEVEAATLAMFSSSFSPSLSSDRWSNY